MNNGTLTARLSAQGQRLIERREMNYTARLIPHRDGVAVSLEAARVL